MRSNRQVYCGAACKRATARDLVPQRWRHISSRYGLSVAEIEAKLAAQGHACAICRTALLGHARERDAPQVDHDHDSGVIRDILCRNCNTALGNFKDDPATVGKALAYLERWKA